MKKFRFKSIIQSDFSLSVKKKNYAQVQNYTQGLDFIRIAMELDEKTSKAYNALIIHNLQVFTRNVNYANNCAIT